MPVSGEPISGEEREPGKNENIFQLLDGLDRLQITFSDIEPLPKKTGITHRDLRKTDPENPDAPTEEELLLQKAETVLSWEEAEVCYCRAFDLSVTGETGEEENDHTKKPVLIELSLYDERAMSEEEKQELLPKRRELLEELHLENLQVVRIADEKEWKNREEFEKEGFHIEQITKSPDGKALYYELPALSIEDGVIRFQMNRLTPFVLLSREKASEAGNGEDDFFGGDAEVIKFEDITDAAAEEIRTEENGVRQLLSGGEGYEISLTYENEANIPEGAELVVNEITEKSGDYDVLTEKTEETLQVNADEILSVTFVDLSIEKDGEAIEPAVPVDVQIRLKDKETAQTKEEVSVVHFGDETEILDADTENAEDAEVVSFTADGFSVYAVVYTVDFHWGDVTYDLSGGRSLLFSTLLKILDVREFSIEDVADIRFSDPELLSVAKLEGLEAIQEALQNINIAQESPAITEDDFEADKYNEAVVESPDNDESERTVFLDTVIAPEDVTWSTDWLLTSLQPFETIETLSVTLKNGQTVRITVTDAQSATLNGFTYTIDIDGCLAVNRAMYPLVMYTMMTKMAKMTITFFVVPMLIIILSCIR